MLTKYKMIQSEITLTLNYTRAKNKLQESNNYVFLAHCSAVPEGKRV